MDGERVCVYVFTFSFCHTSLRFFFSLIFDVYNRSAVNGVIILFILRWRDVNTAHMLFDSVPLTFYILFYFNVWAICVYQIVQLHCRLYVCVCVRFFYISYPLYIFDNCLQFFIVSLV